MSTTVLISPVRPDGDAERSRALLTEAELAALAARPKGRAQARSVVARALLRLELSRRLGTAPRDIALERGPLGKPYLAQDGPWHFNVTHSADRVLIALSDRGPVGIDIEWRARSVRTKALSEQYFGADEQVEMTRLHPDAQVYRFFQLWTIKEAVTKAVGESLWHTLSGIEVVGMDAHQPELRLSGSAARTGPIGWCHIDLGEAYSLGLAQLAEPVGEGPALFETGFDGGKTPLDRRPDVIGRTALKHSPIDG